MCATFVERNTHEEQLVELIESHVALESLKEAFKASTVKLYVASSAEPLSVGVRPDGLTYRNFEDGSTHSVFVEKAQDDFGPLFSILDLNNPNLSAYYRGFSEGSAIDPH